MQTLATITRIIRLYSLALWVGGLVFFVVVAAVAFGNLPSTHQAGIVVRGSLLAIHNIGLVAGVLYIVATLLLTAFAGPSRIHFAETALVVVMLGLTWYSQDRIIPAMERDRLALGGEVTDANRNTPEHAEFDRLHNLSTKVEGVVLIAGLITLALAAVPTKHKV